MYRAIEDLPDELLSTIFEEREFAERSVRDRGQSRQEWVQPLRTSYLRLPTRDKFNVTSVSRRWFSVASSTPRLWDELYIDIDWNSIILTNATRQILHRSKNLPLTVSITNLTDQSFFQTGPKVYEVCSGRTQAEILHSIEGLFAVLAPISPRISSLALRLAGPSDGFALLSKWSTPLRIVQVVSIETVRCEEDDNRLELPLTFLSCIHTPSIIHVTNFQEISWVLGDRRTLPFTKIWINGSCGITTKNLLALIKLCNNLNSLRLFDLDDYIEDSWVYEELTFASLREVHIDTCSSNFVQQLIQTGPFPTFPNVTDLTVYDALYPFFEGFHQVFAHNFPSLRELSMYLDMTEENDEHALFLRNLPPRLEVLRLFGLLIDGFITFLVQQPVYLPELRVLWLNGCFWWDLQEIEEVEGLIKVRELDVIVCESDEDEQSI